MAVRAARLTRWLRARSASRRRVTREALTLAHGSGVPLALCVAGQLCARLPFLVMPLVWKWLVDALVEGRLPHLSPSAAALGLACGGGLLLVGSGNAWLEARARERIGVAVRSKLLKALERERAGTLDAEQDGQLVAHFTNDVPQVENLVAVAFPGMLASALAAALIFAFVAWADAPLAWAMLAAAPALAVLSLAGRGAARKAGARVGAAESAAVSAVGEGMAHRRDLRDLGGLARTLAPRLEYVYRQRHRALLWLLFASEQRLAAGRLLAWVLFGGFILLVFRQVIAGAITLGTSFAVLEYMLLLHREGHMLRMGDAATQTGLASLERLRTKLDKLAPAPREQEAHAETTGPPLELRAVSFTYPGRQEAILEQANLVLGVGDCVVVEGESGIGKTTLARLCAGHLVPGKGEVRTCGAAPWMLMDEDRAQRVAFLPQSPAVLTATVRENLTVGLESAPGDDELWEVLRQTRLDSLVQDRSGGLNAPLGPEGMALSQGQRQRLGLARLLLRDVPLWVLDEPTSALDEETEAAVLEALRLAVAERAVLLFTHRVGPRRLATRRYRLRRGSLLLVGRGEQEGRAQFCVTTQQDCASLSP